MPETREELQKRRDELALLFADPIVSSNPERIKALTFEFAEVQKKIAQLRDQGLTDSLDSLPVIMEIRAGTGGQEAALFAGELLRMYEKFVAKKGWLISVIDENKDDLGGYKEVVIEIKGKNAYGLLRQEAGTHRVQRIPLTEKSGRIHTSTATVAVLPEVTDARIEIRSEDIEVQTAKSSGPGGQNVNKRMTACRIHHKPTGIIVSSQVERSLEQNRQRALQVLKAKLYALAQEKTQSSLAQERSSQIGRGERAEKIKTYNFPQDRLTDHRLNKSWHHLEGILQGNIDEMIQEEAKILSV